MSKTKKTKKNIHSRQSSSPPPSSRIIRCSGSQDSFSIVDPYCSSGGINSGGQWPIPNCGGPMCHHGPSSSQHPPMGMTQSHMPMLAHGPSMTSLHGPLPPPPLCNPCSQPNNFNSVPLPGPSSRWGPRTSCPVHSPFRARIPNGTICSGHQCKEYFNCLSSYKTHFKFAHYCDNVERYTCTYLECSNDFTELKNLLRHLKNKHKFSQSLSKQQKISNNTNENQNYDFSASVSYSIDEEALIQNDEQLKNKLCEDECNSSIREEIETKLFNFLSKMHKNSNLTKKIITEIFVSIKENLIDTILSKFNVSEENKMIFEECFQKLNTQYKYEKMLKSKGLVSKAINETIVFKTGNVFKNGISVIGTIKENVSLMPVMQMLKSIFTLPNILKDVLNNMNELERSKNIIIPFDYYIDDFETGNALGSNAGTHKITAHYISFPTFPQHSLSSTKYVFEVLLSPATLQHNEMQYCLEPLINIFKELEEEGIELEIDGENKTVFFVMGRVIGDNLALNEILGFSKSFNANRFCRMCDAQKQQTQAISISSESDLRSKEQYEVALSMNDAKETGVYETCYFNELKNFHCTENICCDILHDVFEGLAKYDLALCLKAIIDDKNLPTITLDKNKYI
ncbi:hypothetical protein PVAND_003067 [Polypedilum vanderplanki]|uniref:C2H2-type domain-containing protein n=1 Tax=Polypedilum vanderplanki TaxID=319348 RepID=A0A9J6BSZ3_POLVA|nr:hypothetical protein PVAND_003067 [Polypedilum vanderplanki]